MDNAVQNSIPRGMADSLIAAHDGDVALLYIWLSQNGALDADKAARELCRTEGEIKNAYEKLMRLIPAAGAKPVQSEPEKEKKLPPPEELSIFRWAIRFFWTPP